MGDNVDTGTARSPTLIAQRYRVIEALGKGGMACVYRVSDESNARVLALKQLQPPRGETRNAVIALFEAEFNTLAQISHPCVIEVYDYGLDEAGPFYTMELLDGGDLYDRSPLPWREACGLLYDVCSSLALLHSRRFVHRDVSPRNVRCTRDGSAKLIDFGTMVPMGNSGVMAGTPAFVAPEVVHRSALDGRADLFSLGATLYYALTRRAVFPAREFADLDELWKRRPRAPSSIDPQIPEALDALALQLLSPDPAMRPRNAFEVMQRLSAIAGLARDEPLVSQAYLSSPTLVAREHALAMLGERIGNARAGHGAACLLRSVAGLGRSRMLDACVLEAKARGAIVLRAAIGSTAADARALVQSLADQLLDAASEVALDSARSLGLLESMFEAVPELEPEAASAQRAPGAVQQLRVKRFVGGSSGTSSSGVNELVDGLRRWLVHVSSKRLLVIAVDDIQQSDETSVSLLAALAERAAAHSLLLVLTLETDDQTNAPEAISILAEYCVELELEPLTRLQTEELLSSVFGVVPNLGSLTAVIDELARGNPRECLDLAQYLVDGGVVCYAGGSWTLPAQIDPALLPRSTEDAMRARIALLEPLARFLAEAHVLSSFEGFSREDCIALRPDVDHQSLDRALVQLLSQQILIGDRSRYTLARRRLAVLLLETLDEDQRWEHHRALARLYEQKSPLASVRHLIAAGEGARGLARLMAFITKEVQDASGLWEVTGRMRPADITATFEMAHRVAIELERPRRERVITAGWMVGLSLIDDDAYYFRYAELWRTQLEHDSGYKLYCELDEIADPGARLMRALTLVAERNASTPEAERVYPPEEAIRLLVLYVGVSIAVGTRSYDRTLLTSLPELLEPFAPLAPVIEAVRINALASRDVSCDGRLERGRERWLEVYEKLKGIDRKTLPAVDAFRGAIAYALGLVEARMGLPSAMQWAERLDSDPTQRVSALYLRKVVCLHHGDFEGAERWRKQAEIVALQTPMRQMFTNVVLAELWAHAATGDLVGVKQALERIVPLSARYPGWVPIRELAEAQFELLRGDLPAARAAFERSLVLCRPDASDPGRSIVAWPSCVGAYVETLRRLGEYERARSVAEEALVICAAHGIGVSSHEIVRGLALVTAHLGDYAGAWQRLESLIEQQTRLQITGLQLGATYEACTRVAIWEGDLDRLQRYAQLTAIEYRHGRGSPLGARYERLMEEARSAGLQALPELTDFVSTAMASTRALPRDPATTSVVETMVGASDRRQRAQRALRMLCKARGAHAGHLYLCAARGLALAASEGEAEPAEGLRAFLEQHLAVESGECESATSVATEAALETPSPLTSFCDANGQVHHALVLRGVLDGMVRQVGIVSLVIDPTRARRAIDAQLSSAVAAYLISAGDIAISAAALSGVR